MTAEYLGKNRRVLAWAETSERDGVETEGMAIKYDNGYTGWCPTDIFHQRNMALDALDFSGALFALKEGHRVSRRGWNGKGMFLILVPGSPALTVDEGRPMAKAGVPIGTGFAYGAHIDIWTVGDIVSPWQPSQADMLADDWQIATQESVLDELHQKG